MGSGQFVVRETQSGESAEFQMPLPGEHFLRDALLAIAVGRIHGLDWEALRYALAQYNPLPLRWNEEQIGGVFFINDAYNANPMSMRSALEAFSQRGMEGRRWLVLGGMRELGAAEDSEHESLGGVVASGDWAGLVTVGALGKKITDGARDMPSERRIACSNSEEAVTALKKLVEPGDAVLVKASRGEKLERVVDLWRDGIMD